MAYIDVGCWSAEHVIGWLRGLHESLESASFDQVIRSRVNGNKLLLLSAQDVADTISPIKVEALQAIMRGINQLRYLNYNSRSDTLQSLTLNLACHARYLYNELIQAEHSPRLLPVSTTLVTPMTGIGTNRFDFTKVDSNMQINQSTKQRVSLESLDSVSIIVDQISQIVSWLNSSSLGSKFSKDFKSIILRVAIELTSTAQRDQFVENPNDIIKKTSKFLADYCEWVVLAIDDPDFIQPCWLDVVSVKKKTDEDDFGVVIQPGALDSLNIEEVVFSAAAHRSGRLSKGDEIVQVDYQTVVGWPAERVKDLMKTYTNEIILTIKKKPSQSILNPSVIVIKPYPIPLKRIPSHNSESIHGQDSQSQGRDSFLESQQSLDAVGNLEDVILEPPKEPKGPVYELHQPTKPRREFRRRVSISGSVPDALVDLSLADALPIPTLARAAPVTTGSLHGTSEHSSYHSGASASGSMASEPSSDTKTRFNRVTKETLTKSVSHDTAKLYLHTLSIDRKHLWMPDSQRGT